MKTPDKFVIPVSAFICVTLFKTFWIDGKNQYQLE